MIDNKNQQNDCFISSIDVDKELLISLAKFQSNCPVIEKNKKGYGYKYADHAMIIKTISPILKECNLGYTQLLGGNHLEISIQTIIFSTNSLKMFSSTISSEIEENQGKQKLSIVQRMGATITYLKRYALCAALGIVSEDDPDGIINDSMNNKSQQHHRIAEQTKLKQLSYKEDKKITFSMDEQKEALKKLNSCSNLEQLKETFINLGDQRRNQIVIDMKNDLKTILLNEANENENN